MLVLIGEHATLCIGRRIQITRFYTTSQGTRFHKAMATHTTLNISVTPELIQKLTALAAADGLPTLAYARKILTQHANTHVPAPVPQVFVAPVNAPEAKL